MITALAQRQAGFDIHFNGNIAMPHLRRCSQGRMGLETGCDEIFLAEQKEPCIGLPLQSDFCTA